MAGKYQPESGEVTPEEAHDRRRATFTEAMVNIYRNAKRQAAYDAKIFIGMVLDRGGYETAQYLIYSDQPSIGYTALYERGRLDLTVEALVIQPEWSDLFTDADRVRARDRLRAYGYVPAQPVLEAQRDADVRE